MPKLRTIERRRRALVVAAAAVIAICCAAVAVALASSGGEAVTRGTGAHRLAAPGTATVQRGPLSAQVSTSGTLGYGNPQTVYSLLDKTITWLPQVGQVIEPGQTLYRVENDPVTLFDGTVPAYRNLKPGIADGPDIKELNRNLVTLGFDPDHDITVNDTWQDATTAAVERWQASLGQSETGSISLGQVVFLPGPQRVTKLDATLGTGGGAGHSVPADMSDMTVAPEFVSFSPEDTTSTPTTTTTSTDTTTAETVTTPATTVTETVTTPATTITETTPSSTTPTTTKPSKPTKPGKPQGPGGSQGGHPGGMHGKPGGAHQTPGGAHQTPGGAHQKPGGTHQKPGGAHQTLGGTHQKSGGTQEKQAGAHQTPSGAHQQGGAQQQLGGAHGKSSHRGGPRSTPVLQTTSTVRQVQVQLDASDQASIRVGDPAQITLPNNQTTPGTVTSIGAASGSSSGSGSGATIPVDIELTHPQDAGTLDDAPVQAQITSAGVKNALIVPLDALLALSRGRYAIETIAADGSHRLVPVTLGLINQAENVAQVSARGLSAGQQIVVPSS